MKQSLKTLVLFLLFLIVSSGIVVLIEFVIGRLPEVLAAGVVIALTLFLLQRYDKPSPKRNG